jgi:hypothetical protein
MGTIIANSRLECVALFKHRHIYSKTNRKDHIQPLVQYVTVPYSGPLFFRRALYVSHKLGSELKTSATIKVRLKFGV